MFKKSHYVVFGLVVLLALMVLNLPGRATARLKLAVGSLFLPLFGLASSAQQLADTGSGVILPRGELLRQNESLRRDNEQLRLQAVQAGEIARENARLRQLFGWSRQAQWKFKLANVVLRDPANWWRTIQIDLGSRNGLSNNLPVLTPDGFLLGRISSVSLTHSQVVLVGDLNCRVAVLVENETRDNGVIGAAGPFDSSLVELGYLSHNANLKPGQNVVTSGLGGIFPKGIPVGRVVDTRVGEYGLNTEARVKLAADLGALEEVWVLLP
jgi:rod shape-determining protein MreC